MISKNKNDNGVGLDLPLKIIQLREGRDFITMCLYADDPEEFQDYFVWLNSFFTYE
jgi:hypothetical protein